ncbi:hypothetical protein LSAT2_011158 [Lamellibrachia satsuma]|nr:hypothetical protein LSAT2_011158 [Lamellibrachia satsuma]
MGVNLLKELLASCATSHGTCTAYLAESRKHKDIVDEIDDLKASCGREENIQSLKRKKKRFRSANNGASQADEEDTGAVEEALEVLKNGKTPGPDGMPPEALKTDPITTTDMLHHLFLKICEQEEVPK